LIFYGNAGVYVIKDELDHFEEKIAKIYQYRFSNKVRSASGTVIISFQIPNTA
jgi:hypothetical protein